VGYLSEALDVVKLFHT